MPRVGIALGSNLGDRLANIRAARVRLREIALPGELFLEAAIYQTEPVLCPPDSPQFYNSVVEIGFGGSPFDLLELTKAIEAGIGRITVSERNAPRIIDIDLLYFGDEIIDSDDLMLPHPRIGERRFVLQPLADIRPDLALPGNDRNIKVLLETLMSPEPPLIRVADSDGSKEA